MRKLLLIAVMAVASLSVSARGGLLEYGLKGGITSHRARFVNNTVGDFNLSTSPKTGWHVGGMLRINLPLIHLQPELLYSYNRYEMRSFNTGTNELSTSTVRVSSFDFPIMMGVRLLWFRFQAGPVLNLATDTSVNAHGNAQHSATLHRSTIAYALGIGFDMRGINLDVRYNGQFKRPEQTTVLGGNADAFDRKMKYRSWTFSLGYMF